MNYFLQVSISAFSYFIFNLEFFKVVQSIMQVNKLSKKDLLWTFLCNYLVFLICTNLEFHLILNWFIFLMLLGFELKIIFHLPSKACFTFTAFGILLGLSINIFFRSLIAAMMNIPLYAFDNQVSIPGNLKLYPVLIGFFLTGFLFWVTRRYQTLKDYILVINDAQNLLFLCGLSIAMYLYLCLNLIVYYNGENILIVKLWSMKSSIFVMVGLGLSVTFAMRLAQLNAYRKESMRSKQIMEEEKQREDELRMIAITDPLTGCENRQQLEKRLQRAIDEKKDMYLAFLDLNGLKYVNDTYGHEMGDMYLLELTNAVLEVYRFPHTLYRYGGDEFILLFEHISQVQVMKNLNLMQEFLKRNEQRKSYLFPMSFSYGIASLEECTSVEELLHIADNRMYEMKKQMHARKK